MAQWRNGATVQRRNGVKALEALKAIQPLTFTTFTAFTASTALKKLQLNFLKRRIHFILLQYEQ
jgi:hypothetical protein